MASDVEKTLYSILKTTEFSLQIDESTLPGNEALLLAYVRYILEGIMVEEMLFARLLVTDTKGESIYKVVENFFQEKEIPMNNIIAYTTDGAPAMVGQVQTVVSSFIGKLTLFKQNIGGREFYQFPHLAGLQISDDDLLAYCEHLEVLKADMIKRFTDLLELEPPHWLFDPFCVDTPIVPLYLQEELMGLQSDCEEEAHLQ
ncbi:hypothetical protein LOD99_7395 [Oopsacas minuta]|uniref:DUF4371 domain-containing protein n=1 Tax=Oopsacas minuta TaxID=111878 RepID=A0AAV7JUQ4_9METZ|nr:hypothetical protein LOD99_7395 [Oopsacas minuta]